MYKEGIFTENNSYKKQLQTSHFTLNNPLYSIGSLTENEKLRTCFEKFSLNSKNNFEKTKVITARDIVLSRCQQTEPIPFSECYSDKYENKSFFIYSSKCNNYLDC